MLKEVSFAGDPPPLVMLHGLGGTTRYWTSVFDFSSLERQIELVDLLGFGDSPRPWRTYSLEVHLQALAPVVEKHDRITLVGHSMGANLALALAARYPDRIAHLVLISLPCFYGDVARARRWFSRMHGGWVYTNLLAMALVCMFTRHVAVRILPLVFRTYPREVIEDLVKHNVMSSTTSLWNVVYRHNAAQDAEALPEEMPVTCIHSEDDDMSPVEAIRSLTAGRGWRFVPVAGAGHHPWLRFPERCISLALDPGP